MKEIKIKIGEKEVTVREFTVADQFRLKMNRIASKKVPELSDFLQYCMSKEDFEFINSISANIDKSAADNLINALIEVMEWGEPKEQDFQKPVSN